MSPNYPRQRNERETSGFRHNRPTASIRLSSYLDPRFYLHCCCNVGASAFSWSRCWLSLAFSQKGTKRQKKIRGKTMRLESIAQVLGIVRTNSKATALSVLSLEVLFLVAEKPRTIEELSQLTGSQSAHVNRAVLRFCTWWIKRTKPCERLTLVCLLERKDHNQKGGTEFICHV